MTDSFCRNCGAEFEQDAHFCIECGNPRHEDAPIPVPPPAVSPPGANRRGPQAVLVAAGIVAIALVLVGFLWIRSSVTKSASARQSPASVTSSHNDSSEFGTRGPSTQGTPRQETPRPRRTKPQSVPAPAAPRQQTSAGRDIGASTDPCAGQGFPFEYNLSQSTEAQANSQSGSVTNAVYNVQSILSDLGYQGVSHTIPINPDGWFGPSTTVAVRQFQIDNGVSPTDGIVGPLTWQALSRYC